MSETTKKDAVASIYTPNNDFLQELALSHQRLTVFTKNGVQMHGTIGHLYLDWMRVDCSHSRELLPDEENYVRYDAVSTIKFKKNSAT